MLFKKRTFNERKDRDVFCNGKMFDRKMFLIINNDIEEFSEEDSE